MKSWRVVGALACLSCIVAVIWYVLPDTSARIAQDQTPRPPSEPRLNASLAGIDQPGQFARSEAAPVSAIGRMQPQIARRYGLPCGQSLQAEAGDLAIITLTIADPCRPNTSMRIAHGGLQFTVETDITGGAEVAVPALQNPADITLTQLSGETQTIWTSVSDLERYHRVALFWRAETPMALRAEIRSGQSPQTVLTSTRPGQPSDVLDGTGAYLMALGDRAAGAPILAEVFTAPRDAVGPPRRVRFYLDVTVDAETCGTVAQGGISQTGMFGGASGMSLEVPLPDCETAPSVMSLPNLVRDLTLADG